MNDLAIPIFVLKEYKKGIHTIMNGDYEFIKYEDNYVYIKLYGACAACQFRDYTIQDNIFEAIKEEVSATGRLSPLARVRFSRYADAEARKQLAEVLVTEENLDKKTENLEKKEAALKAQAEKAANDSKLEESVKKQQEMARVQGQIMQAEAAMHNANRQASSLQNQIDNFKNEVKIQEDRGGVSGTDALARIGGTAGGPVGGGVSPVQAEERSVSKSEPFFFSAKVEELIAKAADKAWSAPKNNGQYFIQDGAKSDTTIDEHILSEEKEMNKTLGDIADTLKNSKGAVW